MKELQVKEFIDQLASKAPTPGGGAAAGVSAGLGIGAILMAMLFSNSKKLSEADKTLLEAKIDSFQKSKEKFIAMIDRDATEFEPLAKAYRMAKETEEEKQARQDAIQEGLVIASKVPMDLISEVANILDGFDQILPLIKKTIVSDIGVGLQLLRAAVQSSSLNLYINAGQLRDPQVQAHYRNLASEQVPNIVTELDRYYQQVAALLSE